MKKFSNVVEMVREANQQELSDLQKSYREYFGAKLKKFDAESPADLTDDQKKEFFNEIKKDWEKGSGAKPAGKKDVEEHGVKESQELNEDVTTPEGLALFIQQQEKHFATFLKPKTLTVAVSGKVVTIKPGSGSFTITVDYSKSTIDTTGKPAWPESTSYVELMEYIKKTKFKLNESEDVNEAEITEGDIKSKEDFAKFAKDKLKKVHGDDFDEEKAQKVIDGLSKDAEKDDNWGAAVGKLNKA